MSELKYKVGDKVWIKSIDWYNKYTNGTEVYCGKVPFTSDMKKFCSRVMTISFVHADCYTMVEDLENYYTDEMIECKVEDETKPKFKVGDKITNGKVTLTILKLSLDRYVVKDNFGNCDTLYFNTQDNWKTKPDPKFYIGDRVKWYNRTCYIIDIYTDEDIYTYLIKHDDYREDESFEKWVPEIELTFEDNEETPIKIEGKVITNNDMIVSIDEYILPDGYIFKDENGNVINTTKIVLEKKKEYPKTYEECLSVLGIYNGLPDVEIYNAKPSECKLFESLIRLKRCRDAYWKIAGDELELGKPWEPDYDYNSPPKYTISCYFGDIIKEKYCGQYNRLLSFPTAEMRDAFYENFKSEIEFCKELL